MMLANHSDYIFFINNYPLTIHMDWYDTIIGIKYKEKHTFKENLNKKNMHRILQYYLFKKKYLPNFFQFQENYAWYRLVLNINKVMLCAAIIELKCPSYLFIKDYADKIKDYLGEENFKQLSFIYNTYGTKTKKHPFFGYENFIFDLTEYGSRLFNSIIIDNPHSVLAKIALPMTDSCIDTELSINDLLRIQKFIYD
ncbi:hypothetical protein HQS73_004582 [Salmonella enterica]|nr:hypothetical protein [Salmonella enterica]EFV4531870.1 hypothetical protein [Salmonella enterica]EFW6054774.1 hypothetical protein [Salmonella enterica]EHE9227774.1 hypothetical protein [Salmonella enterica]EHF3428766.1 hypothetical protein [Salmonella enterica]